MLQGKRNLLILQIVLISVFSYVYVQARGDNIIQNLNLFGQVLKNVEEKYVEEVDMAKLLEAATEGLLRPLDPYCHLVEADEHGNFPPPHHGKYEVAGLVLGDFNHSLRIVSTYAGSEPDQRGIRSGDYIYKVNETIVRNFSLPELVQLINEVDTDTLTLAIVPVGSRGSINYRFMRPDVIQNSTPQTVPYAFVTDDRIGYVRLAYLTDQTAEILKTQLDQFAAKNVTQLVLDLRDCANGTVEEAQALAELFLPRGTVFAELSHDTHQAPTQFKTTTAPVWTGPVLLLTNRGTAGMVELLAAAIVEHQRGITVGKPTNGKTGYQELLPVTSTLKIELTTREYLTSRGNSLLREVTKDENGDEKELHPAGLKPTVEVNEKLDKRFIRQLDAQKLIDKFVTDKPLLHADALDEDVQKQLQQFLETEKFETEIELIQELWDDLKLRLEEASLRHNQGELAAAEFALTHDPLYQEAVTLYKGITTTAQLVERGQARQVKAEAEKTEEPDQN
ncbi:MAG: hypothetical protein D6675_10360 [Gemmatimonadetes bacterium]|nr:MAG: hypothetical protein D6675_10360 [Gemmatimonadota bacterium]